MSLGFAVHSARLAPRGARRTPHSVEHHREAPKSYRQAKPADLHSLWRGFLKDHEELFVYFVSRKIAS